ncbi:DUF3237 domain-containing protein [Nocardiopsis sp. RSe5-2]|uniref:UPF0311 protein O4J56_18525 n=1 Tax=Nocardiopsis endophytica TaxID=3018445 RepID=A0ABT4U7E9_9ACTN|nr:DUF3237 domain-containing protein [Nocardiopsis endophytica]MDA2812646.1 DUF3237 domain-containing protein [Nocardiopsis endophytica]
MTPRPPALEFAFEAKVECAAPEAIGDGSRGPLSFVPITGGVVEGPLLNGTVVPGGGDWAVERDERVTDVNARYLIRADDGALIDITNRGHFVADPAVARRAEAREPVDPGEYYFRTSPEFRTDAAEHAWLTRTVFVGEARDEAETGRICIRFFAVR